MVELLGVWRLVEHGLTFFAGIAVTLLTGALAVLIMIRKRLISLDFGISDDWRDSLRQGIIFGLVVVALGLILGSLDFRPLDGFLTRQPLPVGSLVGLVMTILGGMGRWIVNKNQQEHTETRKLVADTRQMLKDHMLEEENIAAQAKLEVSSKFDRFEQRTQQQIAELRELVIAALNRR